MNKKIISILVALSCSIGSAWADSNFTEIKNNETLVNLEATSKKTVENNVAVFDLMFSNKKETSKEISNELNKVSGKVSDITSTYKSIKTSTLSWNAYPMYSQSNKISGWSGQYSVRLESSKISDLIELTQKLQDQGLVISNTTFKVSDSEKSKYENELTSNAIEQIKIKSDNIKIVMKAANSRIRELTVRADTGFNQPRPMMAMAKSARADSFSVEASPSMDPGSSEISVTVSATAVISNSITGSSPK